MQRLVLKEANWTKLSCGYIITASVYGNQGILKAEKEAAEHSVWLLFSSSPPRYTVSLWRTKACIPIGVWLLSLYQKMWNIFRQQSRVTSSSELQRLGAWGLTLFPGVVCCRKLTFSFQKCPKLCWTEDLPPCRGCLQNAIIFGKVVSPYDSPGLGERLPEF